MERVLAMLTELRASVAANSARLDSVDAELAKLKGWGTPIPLDATTANILKAIEELSAAVRALGVRLDACETAQRVKEKPA